MRALVLGGSGVRLERSWSPAAAPGEALIRPLVAGVCATDLELVKGYMDFRGVLGHEWVGVVEEAPDAALVGRRVVGEINCPCRRCETCAAGRGNHCPERTVLGILGRDGVFAERFHLPVENLRLVPDAVPDDVAVFTEPLAAACRIREQVELAAEDRVVVLGAGRLGQLCARVLALTGAQVQVTSRNPARLELLPGGIRGVTADQARELAGADVIVDCTGAPEGLAMATELVRPRGTIVLKTTIHAPGALQPTPWVIDEITLVGSRCGPFAPALELLASGQIDPTPLISARLPLEEGVAALTRAAAPDAVKVLIEL